MSFGNIKDVLSRDEMKGIMAGSGGGGGRVCGSCTKNGIHYACTETSGGHCRCSATTGSC